MTLWSDAPVRPFEVQLPNESVQNPEIPRKFQVRRVMGVRGRAASVLQEGFYGSSSCRPWCPEDVEAALNF